MPAFLFFQRLSASLACAIASAGSMKAQAPTSGSLFSICSKKALTYCSEESSPLFIISSALVAFNLIKFIFRLMIYFVITASASISTFILGSTRAEISNKVDAGL